MHCYIFEVRVSFTTDRLYKFASFNENSISALVDYSVWFSDIESLNDAFEVAVDYELPENEEDKSREAVNLHVETYECALACHGFCHPQDIQKTDNDNQCCILE